MQYKLSFIADFLATAIGIITEFLGVLILFLHIPQLGGWSLPEVAFLYGTAELSLSFAQLMTGGFDRFPDMIRLGEFDRVLIRPRQAFFQVATSDWAIRRLGRTVQGVLVLCVAIVWLSPSWGFFDWVFLIWTLFGGMLLFYGLFVIGGTLSFWTVESLEAMNILTYGGGTLAIYPFNIYAEWMRNFFIFIVPVAFVNYYPSLYLLNKADPFGLPEFLPFVSVPLCSLVLLAALLFWRFGIKHYQSTGH
jgi:ABC-2 type transport system permease protein